MSLLISLSRITHNYRNLLLLALAAVSLQIQSVRSHSKNSVLVKSWEDVQRNFTVSLETETDLFVKQEENIDLEHTFRVPRHWPPFFPIAIQCRLTRIVKNSSHIAVMINGTLETNAKLLTAGMVNIIHWVIIMGVGKIGSPMKKSDFHRSNRTPIQCNIQVIDLYVKRPSERC